MILNWMLADIKQNPSEIDTYPDAWKKPGKNDILEWNVRNEENPVSEDYLISRFPLQKPVWNRRNKH